MVLAGTVFVWAPSLVFSTTVHGRTTIPQNPQVDLVLQHHACCEETACRI